MSFVERYANSLGSLDLRDDEQHRATEALAAAALADLNGGSKVLFGSMLARAKAVGVPRQVFESSTAHLAPLIRTWERAVNEKGTSRGWLKIVHPWDINAARCMYNKIARVSLAHWLDGACETCHGTKIYDRRACTACAGTGREPIKGGALEIERVKDMISELEGLHQSHCARAGAKTRRAA
jgi:hypothetical protein